MRKLLVFSILVGVGMLMITGCEPFFEFHDDNANSSMPDGSSAGDVLFEDDFNGDPRPEWFIKAGTMETEDGWLVMDQSESGEYYVRTSNSPNWDNYTVDIILEHIVRYHSAQWNEAGIILRSERFQSGVLIQLYYDEVRWRPYGTEGGEWRKFANGEKAIEVSFEEWSHIRVKASGSEYTIYVKHNEDGKLSEIGSFVGNQAKQGMPGFFVDSINLSPPAVDHFKITAR